MRQEKQVSQLDNHVSESPKSRSQYRRVVGSRSAQKTSRKAQKDVSVREAIKAGVDYFLLECSGESGLLYVQETAKEEEPIASSEDFACPNEHLRKP